MYLTNYFGVENLENPNNVPVYKNPRDLKKFYCDKLLEKNKVKQKNTKKGKM